MVDSGCHALSRVAAAKEEVLRDGKEIAMVSTWARPTWRQRHRIGASALPQVRQAGICDGITRNASLSACPCRYGKRTHRRSGRN